MSRPGSGRPDLPVHGIGEGIAVALAQAGCDVVLTARRQHEIDAVAAQVRALGRSARAAVKVMDDGGSIINISSTAALKGSPDNGPYAVAKAGVDSLTRTLSLELAGRQIRVNGVAPGPVPTEVFMEFFGATQDDLPKLATKVGIPLGRLGTPDDVANAVVFLASPAAS